MNNKIKLIVIVVCSIYFSCQQLGLTKEKKDNSSLALAAVAVGLSSNCSSTSTCSASACTGFAATGSATLSSASLGADCVNGVNTNMDTNLPTWIKNNFKCSVGYVSGNCYCFKSLNLPGNKSAFYPSGNGNLFESRVTTGNIPNSISTQNIVYSIPINPTKASCNISTQGGLVSIGITVNGLAVFNNAAAPPDVLATEANTFDNYQGHPQNSGIYHHHAAVPKVCGDAATILATAGTVNSTACNNSTLIGIALDGYAIYGQKCNTGTGGDFTPNDLDSLHGHTGVTTHFATATYHYHYAYDSTATIYTLMGSYFYGNNGGTSN